MVYLAPYGWSTPNGIPTHIGLPTTDSLRSPQWFT
jgi:hypothetical protein